MIGRPAEGQRIWYQVVVARGILLVIGVKVNVLAGFGLLVVAVHRTGVAGIDRLVKFGAQDGVQFIQLSFCAKRIVIAQLRPYPVGCDRRG